MNSKEYNINNNTIDLQQQSVKTILRNEKQKLYDEDGNEFFVSSILVVGKDFNKTYRKDLFKLLGIMGNAQIKILMHILNNTTYQNYVLETANVFVGSYEDIINATGCSRQTVAKVLKQLKACNAITKIGTCQYRVNPNLMSVGTEIQQQRIMIQYNDDVINEREI